MLFTLHQVRGSLPSCLTQFTPKMGPPQHMGVASTECTYSSCNLTCWPQFSWHSTCLSPLHCQHVYVQSFTLLTRYRRHITCIYDDCNDKSTLSELQQLRERLERVENSLTMQPQVSDDTTGSTSSEENSMTSWIDSLLEVRSWDALVHQPAVSDIHSSVASKVCGIVEYCGNSITASCATYFEHVHRWMPVISQELFYKALSDAETSPCADVSLLILCIHLMIQVPAGDAKASQLQESLYLTTKCLYVCLLTLLPRSIASLQAGLLIATFEHASGLCEEAYMTIGGCARACSLMRLSRTPGSQVQEGTIDWLRAVEAKNLWWGILIRDRSVLCRGLPLQ